VASVTESAAPPRRVHDPKHPMADREGYVSLPNVSAVDEMVNMIAASRAYQNNVEVMNTAKNMIAKTLTLGS
jgi:flagellar basal-body rod protein FlgC